MSVSTRLACCFVSVVTITGLTSSVAVAQSLAEIARREAARRETIEKPSKVYTNDDLRGSGGGLTTGVAQPVEAAVADAADDDPDAATDAAVDAEIPVDPAAEDETDAAPQTEEYWRGRIMAARERVSRTEVQAAAMQNRVDGLWAEFTAVDDPAQRNLVFQDRQRALDELARLQQEIELQRQEIDNIEDEARRARVPAGWLR